MEAKLFVLCGSRRGMSIFVFHSQNSDWTVSIEESQKQIFHAQGCDRALVFAKAYIFLCEYLSEKYGGY